MKLIMRIIAALCIIILFLVFISPFVTAYGVVTGKLDVVTLEPINSGGDTDG